MAFWKKTLIWCGVALAICVCIFCGLYFAFTNTKLPEMTHGRYNLEKVTVFVSQNEELEQDDFDGSKYLIVKEKYMIESNSPEMGLQPYAGGMEYFLNGQELLIYFADKEDDLAGFGIYKDNTIKIYVEDANGIARFFYYVFAEEGA